MSELASRRLALALCAPIECPCLLTACANQDLLLITAACRIGSQDGDFSPSPPRASLSYVPYASAQKHLHRRSVRLLSRRSGVTVGLVRNVLLSQ